MDDYDVYYDDDASVWVATANDDVYESDCPELAYLWLSTHIMESE